MANSRTPKSNDVEGDQLPQKEANRRPDAIPKRMLQTKPKQQKDLIKERHKDDPKRSGARKRQFRS